MREKIRLLLFGLAVCAASTSPAAAQVQLLMPFACHAEEGKILLAPSRPQRYAIYGRPQLKRLTTCSPFDPDRCHHWSVYRFDIDCGGERTSWQSIVKAITVALLGPHAVGDARPRQTATSATGPAIDIPPGFAPNPMRIARFVPGPAAAEQIALPLKKPDPPPAAKPPQAEPPEAAAPATPPPATAKRTPPGDKTSTKVAKSNGKPGAAPAGSDETTSSLPEPNGASGSLWRDAAMAFTAMLAALIVLTATFLLWRRKAETMPLTLSHETAGLPLLARRPDPGLERTARRRRRSMTATRLRLWDEAWLPRTISEALDVLGVDPAADRDAMKVTVTRLRRAWHPDHALDEHDRRLRERRLKQINVAWDIISGKRRSLWLSVKPRAS